MKVNSKYIWDYNISQADLKNPQVLRWYLSRKINFGDWRSLDRQAVQKNLKFLDIDPFLKKMLKRYYAHQRTKAGS